MRKIGGLIGVAVVWSVIAFSAAAQTWPARPVHLLVGFGAGGPTDIIARVLAAGLSATLGQQVLVENKPGAASNLAADLLANAKPDGYTLMLSSIGPLTVNDVLFSNLPFNPATAFSVITLSAETPSILALAPEVPAKSLKEFVDYAKAKNQAVNYASPGVGLPPHFAAEMFRSKAGFASVHVPYRSGSQVVEALMKSEVQWGFDSPATMTAPHKAGKLRVVATTARERWTGMEDVPTLAELGYADMVVMGWFALIGPAGLPQDIVQRLNAETAKALATDEAKQRIANLGMGISPRMTPAETAAFVAAERTRWLTVAKENNIKVE
jgi:tripartite-type tricarboxylate transporter receptor subunit TctC